jgi:ubiquinone/menaquinone biosynthesis C-methylase UbiE
MKYTKDIYPVRLKELNNLMKSTQNTFFSCFSKVTVLSNMNMRYEKVALNMNLDEHPYVLTRNIVDDAIEMFKKLIEMSFIENNDIKINKFKSNDVIVKHHELWQEIWPRYDENEIQELIDFRGDRLDANNIVKEIEGKICIDFGCGNGSIAFALLERGAKHVLGVDFGERQIELARELAKKRCVEEKTKFIVGNILDTKQPSNKFEFAVASAVFHHLKSKKHIEMALREVARVLKKGGGFYYFVVGSGAISHDLWDVSVDVLADIDINLIEDILKMMNPTRGKMTFITDRLSATYLYSSVEETISMLEKCGFGNFRRLVSPGNDNLSCDIKRVEEDPYGREKLGAGELRYYCELTN